MNIIAITEIYKGESLIGLRLLDLDIGQTKDVSVESIVGVLKLGNVQIMNLELEEDKLIISNNCNCRLSKINGNRLMGESILVIVGHLEGVGYKVADYKGSIVTISKERTVKGIQNGLITNGRVELVNEESVIYGNFNTVSKEEVEKMNRPKQVLKVIGYKDKFNGEYINTTSRSSNWSKGLSPFYLSCDIAKNVENGWQYSKVYTEHVDEQGNPTKEYFDWAYEGFNKVKADRYPMGKGRAPLYSYWNGEKLDYIEARKKIYIPLYAKAVVKSEAYKILKDLYDSGNDIVLWDFDGYDHTKLKMTFDDVINSRRKKMGHAFVLAMLLTGKIEVVDDTVIIK